jgi:hypothetical protein
VLAHGFGVYLTPAPRICVVVEALLQLCALSAVLALLLLWHVINCELLHHFLDQHLSILGGMDAGWLATVVSWCSYCYNRSYLAGACVDGF